MSGGRWSYTVVNHVLVMTDIGVVGGGLLGGEVGSREHVEWV